MQQVEGNLKTFVATEDLEIYRRVKLTRGSGTAVEYSDDGTYIGVTQEKVSSGDFVAVALKTSGRTFDIIATGAISVGALVYGHADGKIGASVNGSALGVALEAAAADLERIETLLS